MLKFPSALVALACTTLAAHADVTLPHLLADHMVIQRDRPVHLWGRAADGEQVSATLGADTQTTMADDIGRWSLYLKPPAAGGPYEVTIKAHNAIVLHDVLVGDVWLASGQSNMEFHLGQADDAQREIAAADYPNIRFLHVDRKASSYPLDDVITSGWARCSAEAAPNFSAVAYFFARDLHKDLKIPVGVIDTSWGGTPVAAFTPMSAIGKDPALMPIFSQWAHFIDQDSTTRLRIEKESRAYDVAAAQAKAAGKPVPDRRWHAFPDSWAPAGIYNGMIAPVTPFAIRGAIWYQGESDANAERAPLYSRVFETMIASWRQAWGVGDFPFLFVQLPNFTAGPHNAWPELREAQLQTLALKNTGMAITLDRGTPDNIHPTHKLDVGMRLAAAARAIAYGESTEYSGPLFRQAVPEDRQIRIWFDHTAGALKAKNGELKTFEVSGADRKFAPATARIEGETIVVTSPEVPAPRYVRYAWSDNPEATLYNAIDLPASPFRSAE